jgi:hypothetical protein
MTVFLQHISPRVNTPFGAFFQPSLFYAGERFVESESPQPLRVGPIDGAGLSFLSGPSSFLLRYQRLSVVRAGVLSEAPAFCRE